MNIIVGISGKKGSGKSLLASFLVSRHGFREYSLAAPLKTRVQSDFSLTKDHTDGKLKEVELPTGWTPRQIMIEYGAFYRKLDPDYWVNQLFERMRYSEEGPNARFVIPDVRYENEAQAIKDRGGFLVRLNRDPKLNIYPTNPLYAKEPSECSLDHYKGWDMVVSSAANRTTNQLIAVAARIVERTTSKVSGKVSDGR